MPNTIRRVPSSLRSTMRRSVRSVRRSRRTRQRRADHATRRDPPRHVKRTVDVEWLIGNSSPDGHCNDDKRQRQVPPDQPRTNPARSGPGVPSQPASPWNVDRHGPIISPSTRSTSTPPVRTGRRSAQRGPVRRSMAAAGSRRQRVTGLHLRAAGHSRGDGHLVFDSAPDSCRHRVGQCGVVRLR